MTFPTDPIVVILQLLEENWDAANTENIVPQFGTGWINPEGGIHQVIVAGDPDEVAAGDSGIYGLESGGGAVQMMRGLVLVECYAEQEASAPNPMKMAHLFSREVQRIVQLNITAHAGYDYITYQGRNRVPPGKSQAPAAFRYSNRIGYAWRYISA